MKKYTRMAWLGMAVVLLLSGCGGQEMPTEAVEEEMTQTQESEKSTLQKRVGSKVPDAFLEKDVKLVSNVEDIEYDPENMDYQLVWSDEFDYEGLPDSTKWGYDTGGHGWGNQELQYYTKEGNAWVEDGRLIIEARKEETEGNDYTSARLVTRGKGDWKYARIEVCAKLPSGRGTWPAIWMLPTDWTYGDWPASGEIDIMEHVGYDQNVVHASVHTQTYHHSIGTQKTNKLKVDGVSEDFHVYAVEWLPDTIKFFIDGEEYFSFTPTKFMPYPSYKEWPFDKRFHLLLNVAYGGSWGGAQGIDDTVLPARMEVDYVRVYQSPQVSDIK